MSSHPCRSAARQTVMDAGLDLQLLRAEAIGALGDDEVVRSRRWRAEIVANGVEEVRWHFQSPDFVPRELLSVVPARTAVVMRRSHRRNLELTARGTRMISIFDVDTIDDDSFAVVRAARGVDYRFSRTSLQTKIVDGREVYLQGPTRHGLPSLLRLSGPSAVQAAGRYWDAVRRASTSAAPAPELLGGLSERQHRVLDLLSVGETDRTIARELDVSLRTVRYDVAAILAALAVPTRFAAGVAVGRLRGGEEQVAPAVVYRALQQGAEP